MSVGSHIKNKKSKANDCNTNATASCHVWKKFIAAMFALAHHRANPLANHLAKGPDMHLAKGLARGLSNQLSI